MRKWRKNVLRYGEDVKESILNTDENDNIIPDKSQWGYCVKFVCNGFRCSCPDDSWYGVYQGANALINWIKEESAEDFVCNRVLPDAMIYSVNSK